MLELIIGRAGTGKTFHCLQRLKRLADAEPLQRRYLLVPAYMTYKLERELAECLGGGMLNTYVLSFQRFAQQLLTEVGGSISPRLTDIGRRLLLKKILLDRSKDERLKYFSKAARQRGFSETLAEQLKELRTYSIDSDRLRELTFELDDELSDKVTDLAMLADDFRETIDGRKNDESDLLELAAQKISESDQIKGADVFIDGFIFFDPQQRNLIRSLLSSARNVHVTLTMEPKVDALENTRELGMFHRAYQTFRSLKKLSAELALDFSIVRLSEAFRFKSEALSLLEEKLFAFPPESSTPDQSSEGVKLIEAASRRVEVEMLARDIKSLLERGFRRREIGVLIRDESYADLIKPAFEKYSIDYFNDAKRAGAHHPLAELIRSSVEAINWKVDAIFRCLRTGFFDVEREAIDLLENYAIEFGVRGRKKWTQEEPWTWHRREVDDDLDRQAEWQKERSAAADETRRRIIEPFMDFSDRLKAARTIREKSEAVYSLLERLNVHETLERWSKETRDLALSKEHLKIWDDVTIMLEQFAEALGEEELTAREFEALINEGLDALTVSLIPPGLDEVTIAQFDQNSLQNSRAIYVLGFSDGLMPRRSTEKGLFSDADRLHLRDLGVEISLGGLESSLAEKFLLYRALTEAREYLWLSYPLADAEGKSMKPSSLLDRVRKLLPTLEKKFVPIDVLSPEERRAPEPIKMKLDQETARRLFTRRNKLSGSVTRFEKFMACPFKHFAQYGLRLEERREWKFRPPDVGNILHALLKKFGERMEREKRRWGSVTEFELQPIVDELIDEIAPRLHNRLLKSTRAYEYQLERIRRLSTESLKRLISLDKVSKFHPRLLETSFGRYGEPQFGFNLDGGRLELNGRIDRIDVDERGEYFLIIDYKTGANVSLRAVDFYFGINLQLLTYLLAANEALDERLKPAGMFYFLLRYPPKTVDGEITEEDARDELEKDLRMPGMMLKDKSIVDEIDRTRRFIRAKFTDDGNFYSTTNAKTPEEIDQLLLYVREIFRSIGERILDGEIAARPFRKDDEQNGCRYCEFKAMCGFDPNSKNWLVLPNWDDTTALKAISKKLASDGGDSTLLEPIVDEKKQFDLERAARLKKGSDDIIGSIDPATGKIS